MNNRFRFYGDLMNFWVQKIQLLLLRLTNGTKQQRRIDDSSHNSQMAVRSNAYTHSWYGYEYAHIRRKIRSNAHCYPLDINSEHNREYCEEFTSVKRRIYVYTTYTHGSVTHIFIYVYKLHVVGSISIW